jgi:hypothetical protein
MENNNQGSYVYGKIFTIRYVGSAEGLMDFLNNLAIGLK